MKYEKDDIFDTMRQAELFALAHEAMVENRLAWRRDLDNFTKVRCMIDDMIMDKRVARRAIKLSGGGNQPPPDVDQWTQESSTGGQWQGHRRNEMRRATASRGRSQRNQEGSLKKPSRKARAKAGVEARPKAREKASYATCAEGLGTPRGCAPVKDGSTTWRRTRPKEKTPMKTAAGPKRTTRHSNWSTLAAILV